MTLTVALVSRSLSTGVRLQEKEPHAAACAAMHASTTTAMHALLVMPVHCIFCAQQPRGDSVSHILKLLEVYPPTFVKDFGIFLGISMGRFVCLVLV